MTDKIKNSDQSGVDKTLVAMFLKLSPKERLQMNDNAVRTILELRDAFKQKRSGKDSIKLAKNFTYK